MNVQRFEALTLRDALAKARKAFGDNTLILSNRSVPTGVEVLATAESALADANPGKRRSSRPAADAPQARRNSVDDDTERLAMSTLSFQDYVRERMLSKRQQSSGGGTDGGAVQGPSVRNTGAASPPPEVLVGPTPRQQTTSKPRVVAKRTVTPVQIADQISALQGMMEDRLGALAWLGQNRNQPIHSNLLLKLVRAGYSTRFSREIISRLPQEMNARDGVRTMMGLLAKAIHTDEDTPMMADQAGTFAVIGPAGVGKTSIVGKLAAKSVKANGAAGVGLISLDTQRAGAHEQLRAIGRTLGVVAHLAHDRGALQELLGLLGGKKVVLIDTAGYSPNDRRLADALEVVGIDGVKHMLVLDATAQGEVTECAIAAYRTDRLIGTVLAKTDEAVKLGAILDAVIRHRLVVRGIGAGQGGADDLLPARREDLVRLSMRSQGRSIYDPGSDDMAILFASESEKQARSSGSDDAR